MDLLLPAGLAVASLGLTYFVCIRPMKNGGHCAMMPGTRTTTGTKQSCCSPEDEAEAAQLRSELAALRQEVPGAPAGRSSAGN